MGQFRHDIYLPKNLPENAFLHLDMKMDTKEISGGRDDIILRPPGTYKVETFKHNGRLVIQRRYNLSSKPFFDSGFENLYRRKRFLSNIPEIPQDIPDIPAFETKVPDIVPNTTGIMENISEVTGNMGKDPNITGMADVSGVDGNILNLIKNESTNIDVTGEIGKVTEVMENAGIAGSLSDAGGGQLMLDMANVAAKSQGFQKFLQDGDVLDFIFSQIPSHLSSFNDSLGNLEEKLKSFLNMNTNNISRELHEMNITEEDQLFQVTLFRSIDPTSLYVWKTRRMTGFNISWHYEDESGNILNITEGSRHKDYTKENTFFIQWINTFAKAVDQIGEKKLWEAIKKTRKEYVEYFLEYQENLYRRLPSLDFGPLDLTAVAQMLKMLYEKNVNMDGDLISFNGSAMMKTFRGIAGINFLVDDDILKKEDLADELLLKGSEMFLYLFSLPRNAELSLIEVWKDFYRDLFENYDLSTILQTLSNLIKPELKSRRNQGSVAEKLFGQLDKLLGFEYGKLDILMSTRDDIIKRIDRIQLKNYVPMIEDLMNETHLTLLDITELSKLCIQT